MITVRNFPAYFWISLWTTPEVKNDKYLLKILAFAIDNRACSTQLKPFKRFLKNGNVTSAYQTVLGNLDWLKVQGLFLDEKYVEGKAKNIGVTWQKKGIRNTQFEIKDGKANGYLRYYHSNGQLWYELKYLTDSQLRTSKYFNDKGEVQDYSIKN